MADERASTIGLVTGLTGCRKRTAPANHEIVAVDHFRAAADAEDRHHIGRGAAFDLLGILGVIGDEAAADFMGIGTAHQDSIAAGELPVDPGHAGRQQAFSRAQRAYRAGVDG